MATEAYPLDKGVEEICADLGGFGMKEVEVDWYRANGVPSLSVSAAGDCGGGWVRVTAKQEGDAIPDCMMQGPVTVDGGLDRYAGIDCMYGDHWYVGQGLLALAGYFSARRPEIDEPKQTEAGIVNLRSLGSGTIDLGRADGERFTFIPVRATDGMLDRG